MHFTGGSTYKGWIETNHFSWDVEVSNGVAGFFVWVGSVMSYCRWTRCCYGSGRPPCLNWIVVRFLHCTCKVQRFLFLVGCHVLRSLFNLRWWIRCKRCWKRVVWSHFLLSCRISLWRLVLLRMDTVSLNSLVFPFRFWFTLSNGAKSPFLRIYTVFFGSSRSKGMFQKSMEKVEILPPFWRLNSSSGGPSSISGGFGRKDGETQLIWGKRWQHVVLYVTPRWAHSYRWSYNPL